METFRTEDLQRIDFDIQMSTSDGKPIPDAPVQQMSLLYNTNVISTHEAEILITTGGYETDQRVTCMTVKQADNIATKCPQPRIVDIIRNMNDDCIARLLTKLSPTGKHNMYDIVKNVIDRKGDTLTPNESRMNAALQAILR